MKRARTRTEVTQTIDTWSFGCVLSVLATWVVLGFQGIRQYSVLRRLASSERENIGKPTDKFHDGIHVFPEIKAWHTFLKSHIRSSDTATPLILDLIEARMLRSDPTDRLKSDKMCDELAEIIARAQRNHDKKEAEETDDSVKRALLVIDESAISVDGKTSHPETTTVKSQIHFSIVHEGVPPSKFHMPIDSSHPESKRAGKDAKLQRIPLAKTPHRREILEQEMKNSRIFLENQEDIEHSKHYGEVTDSPIGNPFPEGPAQFWNNAASPPIPNGLSGPPAKQTVHPGYHLRQLSPPRQTVVPNIRSPSPRKSPQSKHPNEDSTKAKNTSERRVGFVPAIHRPPSSNYSSSSSNVPEWESTSAAPNVTATHTAARQVPTAWDNEVARHLSPSFQRPDSSGSALGALDPAQHHDIDYYGGTQHFGTASLVPPQANSHTPETKTLINDPVYGSPTLEVKANPAPTNQNGLGIESVDNQSSRFAEGASRLDPEHKSPVSGTDDVFARASQRGEARGDSVSARQSADHNRSSITVPTPIPLPRHVYNLEWDVCKVRKELEAKKPKSNLAKLKVMIGKEDKDGPLATHVHDRDIVSRHPLCPYMEFLTIFRYSSLTMERP